MTEPNTIDDIFRESKEKLERLARIVPARVATPKELTDQFLNLYRLIVTLQAECDMLKVWVDELRNNQVVPGDSSVVEDTLPDEPSSE